MALGGKMVQLGPEVVQELAEERVGWQRETSLHVGRQEDPLTLARLRLRLTPRQPPRVLRDETVHDEIFHITRLQA